jgi:hypothetical protein
MALKEDHFVFNQEAEAIQVFNGSTALPGVNGNHETLHGWFVPWESIKGFGGGTVLRQVHKGISALE